MRATIDTTPFENEDSTEAPKRITHNLVLLTSDSYFPMKQYVIDQLRPHDHQKLKAYLDTHLETGALPGIYRLHLSPEILDTIQVGHPECRPYVAVELEPDRISCELLVRSCIKMRCDCMGYVSHRQRDWLIDRFETILNELEIAL